jgi:hypothetical protein
MLCITGESGDTFTENSQAGPGGQNGQPLSRRKRVDGFIQTLGRDHFGAITAIGEPAPMFHAVITAHHHKNE